MSRKLTLADIWRLVQDYSLPNWLPIVIVGENQVAVSAEIVWQSGFDEDGETMEEPVAVLIQLVPTLH